MIGGTGAVPTSCIGVRGVTEPDSGAGTAPSPGPLRTYLPLAALPTAPGCARGHVRTVAREWGLAELADTAELLASELVTNAVQASARLTLGAGVATIPVVLLWVACDRASLFIGVWDASDELPVRRDAAADEDSGRGLMLVETLSTEYGAYRRAEGKVVWCQIA